MKKTITRLAVIQLLAFMIITVSLAAYLIGEEYDAYAETSGECGTNTTYVIDDDGVMTISGTGTIEQKSRANQYPWYNDRTTVKKLVLEEGVTNAPNSSFNGMTNLTEVELPSTLDTWGTSVFASSTAIETIKVAEGGAFSAENNILYGGDKTRLILSAKGAKGEIVLPSTVTTIDANGLDGRSEITSLTLPDGLQSIGNYAFRGLSGVSTLVIPSTVTSIGTYAFANMTEIEEITIPDGITAFSNYMFSGCSSLQRVNYSDDIATMGTYVFQNCTSLKTFTVPENIKALGGNAFRGCTSLETVVLPEGLTTMAASVFQDCTSLKNVNIPSGVKILGASATSSSIFLNCTSLESIELPSELTTIGASSFKGCTSLKSIDIPESVATIGTMAFQQCTSLKKIAIPEGVTTLTATFAGCSGLEEVTLPSTLKSLTAGSVNAPGVFTECSSLETIEIPEQVTAITKDTFGGCTSLKTLGISDGVTTIGQDSYKGCTSLEDITIPQSVTTVMGGAFDNCTSLVKVRLEDGMLEFNTTNRSATAAFRNCDRLTDLYFPDSLEAFQPITFEQATSIQTIHVGENSNFAFEDGVLYNKGKTKLEYITAGYAGKLVLPETVVETGSRVAGYTHALTEIVFPDGFKTIGDSAFYYADGLKKVSLPNTLEKIGASGFRATGLESIDIPDSVTEVGGNAFTICDKMKSARIGKGVKSIPSAMFMNCYKLADVKMPEELEQVGAQAFQGTMIPEIELPDGCTTVGATAFANNTNLNSIILPASLTSIPKTAFNNDTGLKYIYYKGTQDQWTALNCTPAYGTVITDYKGIDPDLAPAVIAEQPKNAVYEKDEEPEALTVKVQPTDTDGEQYFYTWYKNVTGEPEGGTTVAGTAIENGSSCVPTTDKIGTEYYYCVVTRMVNGYTAERTISDIAGVTVKMDLDGSGSESDPFILKTAEDMKTVYNTVKAGNSLAGVYLKMAADIELPVDWDPIGTLKEGETQSAQGKNVDPFSGVFDGGGFTIEVPEGGKPLFGFVRNATIRNLNIHGVKIDGTGLVNHYERDYEAGSSQSEFGQDAKYIVTIENVILKSGTKTRESGLIGENNNSQDASGKNPVLIVSCKAEEGVEIGYEHDESQIGSFTGRVCGTVINCKSWADVYGTERVGGISGCQDVAMGILHVINSSFHGTVHATGDMVGGILGTGYRGSAPNALCVEIRNCCSDGTVEGRNMVGGIMGAEDEVAQCWGNGIGYIYNNLFTGTIRAAENAKYVGGTVGYYRSLNKYTNFENNFYKEGCGAERGIGGAQFIDTNADHETETDTTYFSTEKGVAGLPYVQFCDWKAGLNRTDDPFGADKDMLSYKASASELSDINGILKKLNEHNTGMHNWEMGEDGYPVTNEEPVCYMLELSGEYKTEYTIGDEFDIEGMKFKATWTDGKETEPNPKEITFTGYDKETRGFQTITASYGAAATEFIVKVVKKDSGEKITVYFTMYGDDAHGDITVPHTLKMDTLKLWIPETSVEAGLNDTAMDVLLNVLEKEGYGVRHDGSYVSSIVKDGQELSEFTNGINSGWMYTLNGEHSQNMLPEQFLDDGDEIVFHYTDDYTFESDTLDVTDVKELIAIIDGLPDTESITPDNKEEIERANELLAGLKDNTDKLVSSAQLQKLADATEALREAMIERANARIDAIGEVTLDSEDAIVAAREAYDALSADEKSEISAERKETLATAEQKLSSLKIAALEKELQQAEEDAKADYEDKINKAKEEAKADYEQKIADAQAEYEKKLQEMADGAAEKELTKAKADAAKAMGMVKVEDFSEADRDTVAAALETAIDELEAAKTPEEVAAALEKLNEVISGCTTAADEKKAKDDVEAKELSETKAKAEEEISNYLAANTDKMYSDDLAAVQVAMLQSILDLRDAKSAEDAAKAVASVKAVIDEKVAFKEKTEAEISAAKAYKVKGLKAKAKKRKFTVKWKKISGANGYQVQYKLKSAKKFRKLKTLAKNKVKSKKLKKGKKYIFRVRTYTEINGEKVYGKWSKTKAVKCK